MSAGASPFRKPSRMRIRVAPDVSTNDCAAAAPSPTTITGHQNPTEAPGTQLVTATPQRFADFPDVPTALEKGIEGPEYFNPLVGVAVRRGTPPERVRRLHDALRRATEDPDFVKAMNDIGLKHGYMAPETFDGITAKAEARAVPLMKDLKLLP